MAKLTGLFIPKIILQDDALSMSEKLILSEIHYLDRGDNGCYATNAHLGDVVGLSNRQVSAVIRRLRSSGYIEWIRNEANRSWRTLHSNVQLEEQDIATVEFMRGREPEDAPAQDWDFLAGGMDRDLVAHDDF